MKKKLTILSLLIFNLTFGNNNSKGLINDPIIIEITDSTLENINYHQNSFTEPTKLVYTNLTSVSGSVYFHENVNLVEVDFPLLQNTGSYFYVYGNSSLEIVNAPNLTTVVDYLYVSGNTSLQELNICNLTEILEIDSFSVPYYNISNNNNTIDTNPPCFSQGAPENLAIDNTTIPENQSIGSLVGTLTADSNYPNGTLTYYLSEFELDNDKFSTTNNELRSNESFDYEIQNSFTIRLGVRNQLGEKLESEFTISIEDIINETITVIEITDSTLENINYHQNSFTEPTKLVYTNLTSVSGSVYFHENVNLVEVDFPLLQDTGSYFYINGNSSLEIVNAPNLTTVVDYLYVSGNTSLQELNICNLTEILEIDSFSVPYYNISNNNNTIDTNPPCFSQGAPENLAIDNTTIPENQSIGSLVGTLTADSNYPNGTLTYYLSEFELDNDKFSITSNQLVSNAPFDYEIQNSYTIRLGVRNQLGEKLESEFTISIEDIINETITVIEITDSTLENIYYHQDNSFIQPTKLVFTNLTSVSGSVYFHENVNLVEVDFPLLQDTGSYFYVNGNSSLEIVNAPNLTTVVDYLYVSDNTSLQALNICNLTEILETDSNEEPYYYIRNNPNLDFSTTCLINTIVTFNPVTNIVIEPTPNSLIGTFSTDADSTADMRYYFVDESGNEILSDGFVIISNGVYLRREYEEYDTFDFTLEVNAIRTFNITSGRLGQSTNTQRLNNSLNEKIDLTISFNIEGATLSIDSIFLEDQVYLYPNPANNFVYIKSKSDINTINIYDITGKLVKIFKNNENKFDISNLTSGIYLIKMIQNEIIYSKKLIIN